MSCHVDLPGVALPVRSGVQAEEVAGTVVRPAEVAGTAVQAVAEQGQHSTPLLLPSLQKLAVSNAIKMELK